MKRSASGLGKDSMYAKKRVTSHPRVVVRAPHRLIRPEEKKCMDVNVNQRFTVSGGILPLNLTLVGAGIVNRIGNKITMKSVHLRGVIQFDPLQTGNATPELLRLLVVYDRQPNGVTPPLAAIIQGLDRNNTSLGSSTFQPMNIANSERFLMLADIMHYIPNNNSTIVGLRPIETALLPYSGNKEAHFSRFIRLKDLETQYQGSSGVVGDLSSGALWLVAFTSNADETCKVDIGCRLRFYG